MTAGGYQLQVPQGSYTVSATGSGLPGLFQATGVQVVSANVKVDFNAQAAPVATAPSAPTGVVATTAKRRATVLWSPPASNGGRTVSSYVVQASNDGGRTWQTVRTVNGKTTSASVSGLQYGTTYLFRVAARNAAGVSPFSTPSGGVAPSRPPV